MAEPTPADNPWTVGESDDWGPICQHPDGQAFTIVHLLGPHDSEAAAMRWLAAALNDAARLEARAVAAETALAEGWTLGQYEATRRALLDVPDQPEPTTDEATP